MEVSIFNNQVLIERKFPGHFTRASYLNKTCPSGYHSIIRKGQYQYYKDNGGNLEYDKYKVVVSLLFGKMLENLFLKGDKIEFPFFGELKIVECRNQLYYISRKIPKYAQGRKKYKVVFLAIEYDKAPMSLYRVFFPKRKAQFFIDHKSSFLRSYFSKEISFAVIKMAQLYKKSKFLKE